MNVTTDIGKFAIFPKSLMGRLSHGATTLYLAIYLYADQEGVCWPGQVRLAADINATQRSVRNWTKELMDAGALTVTKRTTPSGDPDTHMYHLNTVPKVGNLFPQGAERNDTTGAERNDPLTITTGTRPNEGICRFTRPTYEDVLGYMRERNVPDPGMESKKFHDFYTSKGWLVGKVPMKDWKAAVRNWERNITKPKGEREWNDVTA